MVPIADGWTCCLWTCEADHFADEEHQKFSKAQWAACQGHQHALWTSNIQANHRRIAGVWRLNHQRPRLAEQQVAQRGNETTNSGGKRESTRFLSELVECGLPPFQKRRNMQDSYSAIGDGRNELQTIGVKVEETKAPHSILAKSNTTVAVGEVLEGQKNRPAI